MTVSVFPDLPADFFPSSVDGEGHSTVGAFDTWLELATLVFDVSAACICLESEAGPVVAASSSALDGPPTVRLPAPLVQQGFCVVHDARLDTHTCQLPWVTGNPHAVFFAAVALQVPSGQLLGYLCLMHSDSRHFTDRDARTLAAMARLLATDLALQRQAQQAAQRHQALEQSHGWLLESVSQDPLTQVANRRALMAFLDKTLALARRESQPMAVLLLDIQGFRHINAEHGDAVGDSVLAEVASRLSACARGSELVGRMAGDEFMAVLYPCTPDQAAQAAERFAAAVHALPVHLLPSQVQMQVSVTVGRYGADSADGLSPDELYRRAAEALDGAKAALARP